MTAPKLHSRSMGIKLLVVCSLALVMLIPSLFVSGLVNERSQRAAGVVHEISGYVGGQQVFLGPTLAIPYEIPAQTVTESAHHGVYLVFPTQARAMVHTTTQERSRSLFKVPVFQAEMHFAGNFDLAGVPASAPQGAQLDWNHAELEIGVTDLHGALSDASIQIDGKILPLSPASLTGQITLGTTQNPLELMLLGANLQGMVQSGSKFAVTSHLRFSGAQHLSILSYGKTTQLHAYGDWPSPGFDGGFLPVSRTLGNNGYSADWSVPFIARGVRAEGSSLTLTNLDSTALGISFIEVADPYQSVSRALKYALLFLGLLFLTYFVFEISSGKRVHPAQYILVGFAQIIFYLLLLSLAERIGFGGAFLLAGAGTVLLLSLNALWVFRSRIQACRALGIFSLLYFLIYQMLRLEDNALLVGAIASFLAIAATMYFTRHIDWYGSLPVTGKKPSESSEEKPASSNSLLKKTDS